MIITSTFGDRFIEALNLRNLTQVQFCEAYNQFCAEKNIDSSISKTTMTGYVKNVHAPSAQRLTIFAQVLNVTEVWLMGYDVDINGAPLPQTPDLQKSIDALFDQIHSSGNEFVFQGEKRIISEKNLNRCKGMIEHLLGVIYLASDSKEEE